jgi:hypothetical protein
MLPTVVTAARELHCACNERHTSFELCLRPESNPVVACQQLVECIVFNLILVLVNICALHPQPHVAILSTG